MNKPREFWIEPCDTDAKSFKDGYASLSNVEQPRTIHVREVVPIDWEKVLAEFKMRATYRDYSEFSLIQELVEKSLKGEL